MTDYMPVSDLTDGIGSGLVRFSVHICWTGPLAVR
jgi:hypothetical protein